MSQLRIHSINDLHFGKHQGVSFKDLNHDFVVFYGLNESGKSTIAEYLTWTLGGPWRSVKLGSERFRSLTNDHVSGRLDCTLGKEKFDIDAKFKILKSGTPSDLRSGSIGKRTIAVKQFSNEFKGLTPEDFQWIYRLYGVELGRIGTSQDFSNLFTNFTMGNTKTDSNPREAARDLSAEATRLAKDIKDLNKAITSLRVQITDAKRTPDHLDDLRSEQSGIKTAVDALEMERIVLQEQKQLIINARNGSGAINKQLRSQTELETLGSVPGRWGEVIPLASELRRVQIVLQNALEKLTGSQSEAKSALAKIGLTDDSFRNQTLTAVERQQLQSASLEVGKYETNLIDVDSQIAELDRQISAYTSEINAKAPLVGVSPTNLNSVGPQSHITDLQGSAALWLQASQDFTITESALAGAQAHLDEIMIQKDPTQTPTGAKINPMFLFGALVLVAGLSLINPILSLVGALGSAIALAVMSKKGVIGQTATLDQGTRIREVQNKVAQAKSDLAANQIRRDTAANRVTEPITKMGASIPTAETCSSMLTQLAHLANQITERQSVFQKIALVRALKTQSEQSLGTAKEVLQNLLHNRHIDNVPDTSVFNTWLMDYENAVNASQTLVTRTDTHSELKSEFEILLTPIADQIIGLPWSAINNLLSEYEDLTGRITTAQQNLGDSNIEVSAAGMDKPEIRKILETYSSHEALNDRESSLIDSITAISVERDDHIARQTEITIEIDEKEAMEILPSLLLQLGESEESLEDATRDRKAYELASSMLDEMINRFERDNQDPLIQEAQQIISQVVPNWGSLLYSRDDKGNVLIERDGFGGKLIDERLSDGGRALLYLGIRLAFAKKDAEKRGIHLPLICDDPFIHFDDDRTAASIKMFKSIAEQHQVILFTCEESTLDMARAQGAHVIKI